jgi:hypothetical protein
MPLPVSDNPRLTSAVKGLSKRVYETKVFEALPEISGNKAASVFLP